MTGSFKKFVAEIVACINAPYIWGGKGDLLWSPDGLKTHTFRQKVFDCSGLITHALWAAGGPDWRGTHSAQNLYAAFSAVDMSKRPPYVLAFYGSDNNSIIHVGLRVNCFGLTIDAAGGSSDVRDLETAAARNARVRARVDNRHDLVDFRAIQPQYLKLDIQSK